MLNEKMNELCEDCEYYGNRCHCRYEQEELMNIQNLTLTREDSYEGLIHGPVGYYWVRGTHQHGEPFNAGPFMTQEQAMRVLRIVLNISMGRED